MLGALSLVSYLLFYTPLKRKTSLAVWVGAVPGAMPPVLGWSAATGSLDPAAWVLFAIIFFWQIPHFYAIGLFRKEEYAKAGFKIYTLEASSQAIHRQIILFTLVCVGTSLLLIPLQAGGKIYTIASILLGGLFLGSAIFRNKKLPLEAWAKKLFFVSLIYLSGIFGVLFFEGGMG
jgi:protoheme IX farnesyltransferase